MKLPSIYRYATIMLAKQPLKYRRVMRIEVGKIAGGGLFYNSIAQQCDFSLLSQVTWWLGGEHDSN